MLSPVESSAQKRFAPPHRFPLSMLLGTLADGLGSFPLGYETSLSQPVSCVLS